MTETIDEEISAEKASTPRTSVETGGGTIDNVKDKIGGAQHYFIGEPVQGRGRGSGEPRRQRRRRAPDPAHAAAAAAVEGDASGSVEDALPPLPEDMPELIKARTIDESGGGGGDVEERVRALLHEMARVARTPGDPKVRVNELLAIRMQISAALAQPR